MENIAFIGALILIGYLYWKHGDTGHRMGPFEPNLHCPNCGKLLPRYRKAKSIRQLTFGGWTCEDCGCEINGFGKEI